MCWQKSAMTKGSRVCPSVSGIFFANHDSLSEQEPMHFFFLRKIKMLPKEAGTDVAQAL